MNLKLVPAAFALAAAFPLCAQVAPAATQGGLPIVAGGGFSEYITDWSGNLAGPTLWVDWTLDRVPRALHGVGVEVEARDLNFGRTSDNNPRLRQDTAEGGVIYRWEHFDHLRPNAMFLMGFGSIDFNNPANPYYTHDTRSLYATGGGLEVRLQGNVWIREDYEYQFWPDFFRHHALNPQGITIGVVYDFRHRRGR